MWNKLDDRLPDGCVDLEVMYDDGRTQKLCSCDIHWSIYKKEQLPVYWRYTT